MKNKLYEFNAVIYPFRLWVGITPEYETISKKFYGLNSDMERVDITKTAFSFNTTFTIARTAIVSSKRDGWVGCLVRILQPNKMGVKCIAHEAAHCADFVCEELGITRGGFDDGEAYAYLVGWVSECIQKVVDDGKAD